MVIITCVDCGQACERWSKQAKRCMPCCDKRQRLQVKQSLARRKAGIPPRQTLTHDQRWQGFAMRAVLFAKSIGALPALDDGSVPCVDCGEPASCYDHRDYARPLDVAPVCMGCNARRGSACIPAPRVESPKAKCKAA